MGAVAHPTNWGFRFEEFLMCFNAKERGVKRKGTQSL
jgi:hypothetical protein